MTSSILREFAQKLNEAELADEVGYVLYDPNHDVYHGTTGKMAEQTHYQLVDKLKQAKMYRSLTQVKKSIEYRNRQAHYWTDKDINFKVYPVYMELGDPIA